MGRKSIKENKNIYQETRENAGLTRDAASEILDFISADRLVKIENESSDPHPEEILAMSKGYKAPSLCNYYCSQKCPIGQQYVPEVKAKAISQITLEMLSTLTVLNNERDRLIEIVLDGEISDDELPDFIAIHDKLEEMSLEIDSLKLWIENGIASGKLNRSDFE